MIRSSQVNSGRSCDAGLFSFSKNLGAEICNLKNNKSKACCFVQNQSLKLQWKSAAGFTLRASAAAQTADAVNSERTPIISRTKLVSYLSRVKAQFFSFLGLNLKC